VNPLDSLLSQARVQAVQAELAATTARLQELENQSKQSNSQPAIIRQIVVPSCTAALVLPPKPVSSRHYSSACIHVDTTPMQTPGVPMHLRALDVLCSVHLSAYSVEA
jgi:hypothetical protein